MNYPHSLEVLKKIKAADRILLNCHPSPDLDSLGSAIAMYYWLINLKKQPYIFCPTPVNPVFDFLTKGKLVHEVDVNKLDFSKYDLFISLDTAEWRLIVNREDVEKPNLPLIVIDHHDTNQGYGDLSIVDSQRSSVAELLYFLFKDWNTAITREIAQALLAGIIGDTGVFRYTNTSSVTLEVASQLISMGGDKDEVISKVYHQIDPRLLKFWGEALVSLEIDSSQIFAWTAIPHERFSKCGIPVNAKSTVASEFFGRVDSTEFGIVMVETEKNRLDISFRSREDFDVAEIARLFDGGGHTKASGATLSGLPFERAVDKVLSETRSFLKKHAVHRVPANS